jgi:hypothetical protein
VKLAEAQQHIARLCLGAEAPYEDMHQLGGDPAHWQLYRAMVRGRFVEVVGEALPRTREALTEAGLAHLVDAWLATRPPTTRYVRQLSMAFADFGTRHPGSIIAGAAPWALDALRYEAAVMHAHVAIDDAPATLVDFEIELPVAFASTHRFVRAQWSVHEPGDPIAGDFALSVYRERETDVVRTLAFTPVAGDVIEAALDRSRSLATSMREVLGRRRVAAGAAFIDSFAELLGVLLDAGVLRGSHSAR